MAVKQPADSNTEWQHTPTLSSTTGKIEKGLYLKESTIFSNTSPIWLVACAGATRACDTNNPIVRKHQKQAFSELFKYEPHLTFTGIMSVTTDGFARRFRKSGQFSFLMIIAYD